MMCNHRLAAGLDSHWDVEQALLQFRIDREICEWLPEGYRNMCGEVVLLNKVPCGLRWSPRVFNQLLMQKLPSLAWGGGLQVRACLGASPAKKELSFS